MGIGDFMTLCSNKKGSNCSLCWVAWVYKCVFVANPLSLIYEQAQINLTFRRKKNVLGGGIKINELILRHEIQDKNLGYAKCKFKLGWEVL